MTRDQELKLISIGLETLMNKFNHKDKPKVVKTYKKVAKKRAMSTAARKRISLMMKKRWAEAKKQNRNSI